MFGDRHPETLIGLNQLGLLYHKARKYASAEPLLREALTGRPAPSKVAPALSRPREARAPRSALAASHDAL